MGQVAAVTGRQGFQDRLQIRVFLQETGIQRGQLLGEADRHLDPVLGAARGPFRDLEDQALYADAQAPARHGVVR